MLERTRSRAVELARSIQFRLGRCYRACLLEGDGRTPSYEGARVLADLRHFARADTHSFLRDQDLRIDPLSMARIEGRREMVCRIEAFLRLDESGVRRVVEVSDE